MIGKKLIFDIQAFPHRVGLDINKWYKLIEETGVVFWDSSNYPPGHQAIEPKLVDEAANLQIIDIKTLSEDELDKYFGDN